MCSSTSAFVLDIFSIRIRQELDRFLKDTLTFSKIFVKSYVPFQSFSVDQQFFEQFSSIQTPAACKEL
jgi:hypothetical protein